MIHAPVPPEDRAAEGARTAGALEEVETGLVIGADALASTVDTITLGAVVNPADFAKVTGFTV